MRSIAQCNSLACQKVVGETCDLVRSSADKLEAAEAFLSRVTFDVKPFSILATSIDFYDLLSLSRNVDLSSEDIKRAYYHKLLLLHPDKKARKHDITPSDLDQEDNVDISLLKEAFITLSDPQKRRIYDASIARIAHRRPAQIISLEDFIVSEDGTGSTVYSYTCRCGGSYSISEIDLEADIHFINCETCSEAVWVGYQAIEDDTPQG